MTLDELRDINPEVYQLYSNYKTIIQDLRMNRVLDYPTFKHILNAFSLLAKQEYENFLLHQQLIESYIQDMSDFIRQYHINQKLSNKITELSVKHTQPTDILLLDIQDAFVDFPYFKIGSYHYCFAEKQSKLKITNGTQIGGIWMVTSDQPNITIEFENPEIPFDDIYFEMLYPNPKWSNLNWEIYDQIIRTKSDTLSVTTHGIEYNDVYYAILGESYAVKNIDYNLDNTLEEMPLQWVLKDTRIDSIQYYSENLKTLVRKDAHLIQGIPENNTCIAQCLITGGFDDEI